MTYLIKEKNAIDWIYQERLPGLEKDGAFVKLQSMLQEKAVSNIQNPIGIKLPTAKVFKKTRKSLLVSAPQDYKDKSCNILMHRGHVENTIKFLPYTKKTLLFINGNSKAQIKFATESYNLNKQTKIVLTNGSPIALNKKHGLKFYFDQAQRLINKFSITHLPAKVYRKDNTLIIEEIPL